MFKSVAPVIAIALLSGCTLTNGEQYHQATLAAIQASESNLSNTMTNLELQLSNQTDYIESLENQISKLDRKLTKLKQITTNTQQKRVEATSNDDVIIPVATPSIQKSRYDVILGEVEKVTIDSIKQTFDARVDTGAATSSLNAIDIEEFERNGKNWVRFHLSDGDRATDESNWIESPIIRYVKIRQSTNDEMERRAVVELWVKLGSIHEKAQFTLADRSQMSHPILLGREFIRDIALVDVSRKYIQTETK
ncbi:MULTISPECIES: ATP-dependent zinc protease family protein [unclassified Vibrio]|uniref:ATP-dependent zinc protease family protein n=1 Tax=unclassified Vibrio TaxID=2614977 RepID=UPI000B8E701E|nr:MULTISPECIES: ATP-dependent zinc protease [unclassified Vibrio]NAW89833.1 ATP-dependent Zn protease [Vibrio sp. V24_P1S3T111]OXX19465.1 ATP-dependent Zn protease [Vibrio sp. V05_P4A8T149]OXX20903.1 ATP-dependent Zn protease [Vibrio sp. V06_P1A73T115]OXX31249.1 ATP-dependent Zn protease [Vibrio sp. V04_P4A5T148]OXX36610.1 ATP-dependent Zn protease [Vibrio sp. V14_P6S14T42]